MMPRTPADLIASLRHLEALQPSADDARDAVLLLFTQTLLANGFGEAVDIAGLILGMRMPR